MGYVPLGQGPHEEKKQLAVGGFYNNQLQNGIFLNKAAGGTSNRKTQSKVPIFLLIGPNGHGKRHFAGAHRRFSRRMRMCPILPESSIAPPRLPKAGLT